MSQSGALLRVKLGAALTLPFLDGKPVFDFNISERPHPFLLVVGIFGGGGFFHLQLDTAGMKALEVSLEFGAAAALDIGVASGEVHIMAGIYFSLQRKEGSTDLAPILGSDGPVSLRDLLSGEELSFPSAHVQIVLPPSSAKVLMAATGTSK